MVRLEPLDESIDRVMRPGRHVMERAPVLGHEHTAVEPLEERQRVVVSKVAAPET